MIICQDSEEGLNFFCNAEILKQKMGKTDWLYAVKLVKTKIDSDFCLKI